MLWDPIRSLWVAATPEEAVRQLWIRRMVEELGYPKGLLAVEKDFASLNIAGPSRRIDLLCYTPDSSGMRPLLLVECKAGGIGPAAERQVLGYNTLIGAPFVCLISSDGAKTFWREQGKVASVPFLPPYAQLVEKR